MENIFASLCLPEKYEKIDKKGAVSCWYTALGLYRIKRITWHESTIRSANFKIDAVYLRFARNKPIGNKPDQIDGKIIYYRRIFMKIESVSITFIGVLDWAEACRFATERKMVDFTNERNKLDEFLWKVYKCRAFRLKIWFIFHVLCSLITSLENW